MSIKSHLNKEKIKEHVNKAKRGQSILWLYYAGGPDVANSKYNLALLHKKRKETDIARQLFRECEQIYASVYGPDHSETVDAARQASRCV